MQFIHGTMVIIVYGNLLVRLAVQNREAVVHFDISFSPRAEQRSNNAFLRVRSPQIVI